MTDAASSAARRGHHKCISVLLSSGVNLFNSDKVCVVLRKYVPDRSVMTIAVVAGLF